MKQHNTLSARRRFMIKRPSYFFWMLCAAAVAGLWRSAVAWAANLPNIVIIMADDMGYSDPGCFGSEIKTPHIDSLAERGIRFTQFYTNTVCCPARTSLLTGLYPHQAGMGWSVHHGSDIRPPGPYQGYLNQQCVTMAEVLRCAGYQTYMSGKWHVGESRPHWPIDRGFDHYYGLISGASNMFDIRKTMLKEMLPRQMAIDDKPYIPDPDGFYMTDALTDAALTFINKDRQSDKPYFLYLAYTAPHYPLHVPPEEIAKYQGKYTEGWQVMRERRLQRQREMGLIPDHLEPAADDPKIKPWDQVEDQALMDLKMAIYAGQVTRLDENIGKVLAAIEQQGDSDNTLIIFLSDNGAAAAESTDFSDRQRYNVPPWLGGVESYDSYGRSWARVSTTPMRGYKASLYEGGIASPMIAVWPRVITESGGFSNQIAHVIDFMPTVLAITGCEYPRQFNGHDITPPEGISLLPAFEGESQPRPAPLFWEFAGNRAMRDGQWKIVSEPSGDWQLFDLDHDRGECHDLAAQMPERLQAMTTAYEQWARRCGVLPWEQVKSEMVNIRAGDSAPKSEKGH